MLTSPPAGHYKAGVVESRSAKSGYDNATTTGNYITSTDRYEAMDKDGNTQEIEFRVNVTPGEEMKVEIDQIITKQID